MRKDNEFVHYVPILRRMIVLVVVITAVPAVLWTITSFVRAYVAPARVPTFHQLAATALFNAPRNSISPKAAADRPAAATERPKLFGPPPATVEAKTTVESKTTVADASDSPVAAKGALAGDRAPETVASVPPGGAMKIASAPAAAPGESAVPAVAPAATLVEQQTPAGAEAGADDQPAATPLSGPIPLPRQRPRDPSTMRIADMAPSSVPIPRPRPDAAGPGAPTEKTGSPIGFIQNLFH
jgi:hypothetical protein